MMKLLTRVFISIFLCFLLVLLYRAGCEASQKERIRLEDATGKFVEVTLPVKRVVVLTSDALEIVRSLKAEELVVGVYSDISTDPLFWGQLGRKPKVGTWKEPNYELVVELNPDIVLCYGQRPGRDMEKKFEPFGIKVVRLDFYKLKSLEREVQTLGQILKREKEAGQLIGWYQKNLRSMQEILKDVSNRPRVYIEGDSNYHTAGPGSGGHDLCVMAGGQNIASGLSIPYPEVTPEWILTNNPEVIAKITTLSTCRSCYAMRDEAALKGIRDRLVIRPAWEHIKAVKEGRVYIMANEIWTGPRGIIGTICLAKWLYPERFDGVDPKELHRDYLERFQEIEYRGVYVYPVGSRE